MKSTTHHLLLYSMGRYYGNDKLLKKLAVGFIIHVVYQNDLLNQQHASNSFQAANYKNEDHLTKTIVQRLILEHGYVVSFTIEHDSLGELKSYSLYIKLTSEIQ